jgi:hypothetical protein
VKRAALLLLFAAIACKHEAPAPPVTVDAGVAASSASAAVSASASEPSTPAVQNPLRLVVLAWNVAHTKHDEAALRSMYASNVVVNGVKVTANALVAKKVAAFNAAPDYAQTSGAPQFDLDADGTETWARFGKTVTAHGTPKNDSVLLIFDASGKIKEESDDVTAKPEWCLEMSPSGPAGTRLVVPPFRISAADAQARAVASKHVRAKVASPVVAGDRFECARRCAQPGRTCDFRIRLDAGKSTLDSKFVEWLNVDPMTNKLWWETDGDGGPRWESEQL